MAVTPSRERPVSRRFAGRAFGIDLRADFPVPGLLEPVDPGLARHDGGRQLELGVRDAVAADADWPAGTAERTFELSGPDRLHRISRKQDMLLDRLRDPSAAGAAQLPGTADTFAALIGEEYALLVTFRRDRPSIPTRSEPL